MCVAFLSGCRYFFVRYFFLPLFLSLVRPLFTYCFFIYLVIYLFMSAVLSLFMFLFRLYISSSISLFVFVRYLFL